MNFELTEEQEMIRQSARDYAQRELIKDVIERDTNAIYPNEHVKNLKELGFFGIISDEKYGGTGLDYLSYVLAISEFSKIDSAIGVILSVHNSLAIAGIERYGNETQKQKYLPQMTSGEKIGAFLLSEPEAGSDASSQHTTAVDKGDHYLINGTKNWITNANSGGIYLVIAQTHPGKRHHGINAFIVEKDTPGISVGPHEDKMGMRSSDTNSVMFNDVKVPKENRIGEDGFGFKFAMKLLEGGRIGIAAQALGIAAGAYELALKYSKERKAFGTEIINHQAIAFKLADMHTQIQAARLLVYKSACDKDNKEDYDLSGAMAKLYASQVAMDTTVEAVQIHGGNGFVKEYHVERLMRDAKITQIYEGTSEIQKIVISRSILKD